MDKENLKKLLNSLINEGGLFTLDSFVIGRGRLKDYIREISPEWSAWLQRVRTLTYNSFKKDSAPFHLIQIGIQSAEMLQGNNKSRFDTAKSNLLKGLELGLKVVEDDSHNELIEQAQEIKNSLSLNIMQNNPDKRKVFVVHGRNLAIVKEICAFLRSINLDPMEWSEARKLTEKPTPYVGEILNAGFANAQAVLVLFTPDDTAKLTDELIKDDDESYEKEFTPQPRQNVTFEAGMAMGMFPNRTVLVQVGKIRPMSDISGLHIIRLNDSTEMRQELAERLKTAGCDVITENRTSWHREGKFELVVKKKKKIEIVKSSATSTGYNLKCVIKFRREEDIYGGLVKSTNENYILQISLINIGKKKIQDFKVDIQFPSRFLNSYVKGGREIVEKRTRTHRFFRILSSDLTNKTLYPNDEIQVVLLAYLISTPLRFNPSKLMEQKVIINIFAEDSFNKTIRKKMSEFDAPNKKHF